jgi:hypothetical protein
MLAAICQFESSSKYLNYRASQVNEDKSSLPGILNSSNNNNSNKLVKKKSKSEKFLNLSEEEDDKPVSFKKKKMKILKNQLPPKPKTKTKPKHNTSIWRPSNFAIPTADPPKVVSVKKKVLDPATTPVPLPSNLVDLAKAKAEKIGEVLVNQAKEAVETARDAANVNLAVSSYPTANDVPPVLDENFENLDSENGEECHRAALDALVQANEEKARIETKNTLILGHTASQEHLVDDSSDNFPANQESGFIDLDDGLDESGAQELEEAKEILAGKGFGRELARLEIGERLVPAATKRKRKIPKRFVSSASNIAAPDAVEYNVVRINDYRKGSGPCEPLFVQVVWDNVLDDGTNEMTWESVENYVNCASLVSDFAKKVGLKVSFFPKAVKDMTVFRTDDGGCFSCRHNLEPEVIKEMFPDFRGI